MIRRISHIGIAVRSLDESIPFYRDTLGLTFAGTEHVPDQKVTVAFFEAGESRIELLEPTDAESPVARFIEKRGPGIHHLAYECDDLRARLARFARDGVELVDPEPRPGAHHMDIAFLHPRASGGVLTELCQPAEDGST